MMADAPDPLAKPRPPAAGKAVAVVVDSNSFIQVKDLKDAKWRDLVPGVTRVEIMVLPAIISELDTKKNDSKERIRNRARAAFRTIDAASEESPMRLVLKEKPVTVAINLPHVTKVDWTHHPDLDPTRPDDQLVAQALALETDLPIMVLSHDSGPRIAARRAGLTAMTVPDAWLLPDPVDEDRKKLQHLQRENEELRARAPNITVEWTDETDLVFEQLNVLDFAAAEIAELVAAVGAHLPPARATLKMGSGFWIGDDDTEGGFSQDDYDTYMSDYRIFIDTLPDFFRGLAKRVANLSAIATIGFRIENKGSATAEGLTVSFAASDDWILLPDNIQRSGWDDGPIAMPDAPLIPLHARNRRILDRAAQHHQSMSIPVFPQHKPRDATGYYWVSTPNYTSGPAIFECGEFRAKRHYDATIRMWPEPAPSEATLTIDVHASNLAEPILLDRRIRFVERTADWTDPAVRDLLHPWLAKAIEAVVSKACRSGEAKAAPLPRASLAKTWTSVSATRPGEFMSREASQRRLARTDFHSLRDVARHASVSQPIRELRPHHGEGRPRLPLLLSPHALAARSNCHP
jgi:hypothetical protein